MRFSHEEFEKIKTKSGITEKNGELIRNDRKSDSLGRRKNPESERSVSNVVSAKDRRKAKDKKEDRKSVKERPTVVLISLRKRLITDATESLAVGFKYHRDAIADELGMDDSDKNINWEYAQHRTSGPEGVVAVISVPGDETRIKEYNELPVD